MSNPFTKIQSKGSTINEILDEPLTINIKLDDIVVRKQIRTEFDGADHTVASLSKSIKKRGLMQAIGVWAHPTEKTYVLMYGERRFRACHMAGLTQIPAKVYRFPVEGAEAQIKDYQFEENVHRKNFEQFEEAAYLQGKLDELGSIEAVLAEANISRAWFMKTIAILNLPPTTEALVAEGISSDKEVLYTVGNIEREDPAKAAEIVDRLRDSDKSVAARKIVKEVKDRGKPVKTKPKGHGPEGDDRTRDLYRDQEPKATTSKSIGGGGSDILAAMMGSPVDSSSDEEVAPMGSNTPESIFPSNQNTENELPDNSLITSTCDNSDTREWFDKGHKTTRTAPAVLKGLREGTFGLEGAAARRLAAFLSGADATEEDEFSADEIEKMI